MILIYSKSNVFYFVMGIEFGTEGPDGGRVLNAEELGTVLFGVGGLWNGISILLADSNLLIWPLKLSGLARDGTTLAEYRGGKLLLIDEIISGEIAGSLNHGPGLRGTDGASRLDDSVM